MIGFIISGHGHYATGLHSAINLIVGNPEKTIAVDFLESDTAETLQAKFEKAMIALEADAYLFLCDLAGGTPFKTAVNLKLAANQIEVVGGVNLPTIVENLYLRESLSLEALATACVTAGKDAIIRYEKKVRMPIVDTNDSDVLGI